MSENLPANERPQDIEPARSSGFAWGGIALIGIGIVFLLNQLGLLPFDFNWWALFILMPAAAIYYRAWQMWRETERFDRRIRRMVFGATIILFVAVMFLFDLDWGKYWPVFLIAAGIGALLNAERRAQ